MTGIVSGGGGGYDYVQASFPDDADEGESLYHLDNNAAYVYTGVEWTEKTVTDHSQLSGVDSDTHHPRYTDGEVLAAVEAGDLDRVDGVNGHRIRFDSSGSYVEFTDKSNDRSDIVTADTYVNDLSGGTWISDLSPGTIGALPATDYQPEADTHSRPTSTNTGSSSGGWTTIFSGSSGVTESGTDFSVDMAANAFEVTIYKDEDRSRNFSCSMTSNGPHSLSAGGTVPDYSSKTFVSTGQSDHYTNITVSSNYSVNAQVTEIRVYSPPVGGHAHNI
ncbi:hypothetical protein [Halorubrum sp. DTA46]|uniref:hypothetical protein n=1 Tax=Halorubrum sp. DTA46 TaxID=3402162 RepID=UPI003AABEA6B